MKAALQHLSINVSDINFYKELLAYLGYTTVVDYRYGFGATDGSTSVWVFRVQAKYTAHHYHRKAVGLNHLAFRVGSKAQVDEFYQKFLLACGTPVLYGGPAAHLEYEPGYYAVYFEDPDRIKLEVMYLL